MTVWIKFRCKPVPTIFIYKLGLIPAISQNFLWVKTEPTQSRCDADLTHAVSLITALLLNTNAHLLMVAQSK